MNAPNKSVFWSSTVPGLAVIVALGFLMFQYALGWPMFRSASSTAEAAPAYDESLWIVKAQESVRARLRDPSSAEFRGIGVSRKSGAPVVCGQVNSRNGLGGMGGFQSFVFAGSVGTFLAEDMKAGEMKKVWQEMCTG